MKIFHIYLCVCWSAILTVNSMIAGVDNQSGRYYAELQAFKNSPEAKMMFDEDAHQGLAGIQRDMITYKNLTQFQRFVRSIFEACDVVLVTPDTMPLLYEYVDGLCKKANIQTPIVFITRKDIFFNAFAQKLLMSSGGILIGQKLMQELSDEALEAVIAHEIGHIKHNHVNKMLALSTLSILLLCIIVEKYPLLAINIPTDTDEFTWKEMLQGSFKFWVFNKLLGMLQSLIINKRFEKEADAFACSNGKAQGIIEFFELLLKKDQIRAEEFMTIHELLLKNKEQFNSTDYYSLLGRYYIAKAGHNFTNAYKKLYYETFWGAHPSPQARIAAAKQYLAKQNAV